MSTYIICYDLHHEPASVYDKLIEALENAEASHAQESVWVLTSPYTAEQNYNWFKQFMFPSDELLVAELNMSNVWATLNSRTIRAFHEIPRA